MLYKVIYSSEQTRPISKEDLADIIAASVRNNQRSSISGCLLYHGNYFAQVLEGSENHLVELIKKLRRDARHKNMNVSSMNSISERTFGSWHMTLASNDPLSTDFLKKELGLDAFDPAKINDEDLYDLIKKVKWSKI